MTRPRPQPGKTRLRDVVEDDLPLFFEHQCEPEGNRMAAFPPRDRGAFFTHWQTNILGVDTVIKKTILHQDRVAGNVVCYLHSGRWSIGYWLGREFWGRGIATVALKEFLRDSSPRPLYAHVVKTNKGSIRVLEKCGFSLYGEDTSPARDGHEAVEEFIYELGK